MNDVYFPDIIFHINDLAKWCQQSYHQWHNVHDARLIDFRPFHISFLLVFILSFLSCLYKTYKHILPLMQTAQKQHVYLCCAEIKSDDWNQWSLLYSSSLVAFSGWLNDSSSRHPWTEWDAEAEEDVGLCGGERQVHRSTPTNMEESWDGIRVQSLSPPTKERMGLHWDCECKTVEHFIFLKSNFYCQALLYLTKQVRNIGAS